MGGGQGGVERVASVDTHNRRTRGATKGRGRREKWKSLTNPLTFSPEPAAVTVVATRLVAVRACSSFNKSGMR